MTFIKTEKIGSIYILNQNLFFLVLNAMHWQKIIGHFLTKGQLPRNYIWKRKQLYRFRSVVLFLFSSVETPKKQDRTDTTVWKISMKRSTWPINHNDLQIIYFRLIKTHMYDANTNEKHIRMKRAYWVVVGRLPMDKQLKWRCILWAMASVECRICPKFSLTWDQDVTDKPTMAVVDPTAILLIFRNVGIILRNY